MTGETDNPRAISRRNHTLTAPHIWAAYITNQCELCNTPLSIFKCISLWSNYNWAFKCFGPWLRYQHPLTPVQWHRNQHLRRNLFYLITACPKTTGWIIPIKTKAADSLCCQRESECLMLLSWGFFFPELRKFRRNILQQRMQILMWWLDDSCHQVLTAVVKLFIFW